jgi:hypothetical protein
MPPTAPTITSALTASGIVGSTFNYPITATNTPTSYNATGLTGSGLSVNTLTGVISGTPTTADTYSVVMTATNASGSGTANLTITIVSPSTTPTITSITPDPLTYASSTDTITLNGTNFISGCSVTLYDVTNIGGPYVKPTTFISSNQIKVTANFTNTTAIWSAQMTSPTTSNTVQFQVNAQGWVDNQPIITSISATPNSVAPNANVKFTAAATDVDSDILTYSWDFGDSVIGTGSNVSHSYAAVGTYNVKLDVADGKGGHANKNVMVAVVNNEPSPNNGLTLFDNINLTVVNANDTVRITKDAEMPDLIATVRSTNAPANAMVRYKLTIAYKDKKFNNDSRKYTGQVQVGQPWSIRKAMDTDIRGGVAVLSYTIPGVKNSSGSIGFSILAISPDIQQIKDYIKGINAPWYALGIAERESAFNQFNTAGFPLESFDGGFGIYQLTSKGYVTAQIKWSWKANCDTAIFKVMVDKASAAAQSLAKQKLQSGGILIPDIQIMDSSGAINFSDVGTLGSRPMVDAGAIKLYNGGKSYINSNTAELHNFVEFNKSSGWQFYPINTSGLKSPYAPIYYVRDVCNFVIGTE